MSATVAHKKATGICAAIAALFAFSPNTTNNTNVPNARCYWSAPINISSKDTLPVPAFVTICKLHFDCICSLLAAYVSDVLPQDSMRLRHTSLNPVVYRKLRLSLLKNVQPYARSSVDNTKGCAFSNSHAIALGYLYAATDKISTAIIKSCIPAPPHRLTRHHQKGGIKIACKGPFDAAQL